MESAGELVGCRSQARQNELTGMKTGTIGRNDEEERHTGTMIRNDMQDRHMNCSATHPFIDPMVWAGVTTQSDVSSSKSGTLIGPRPAHGPAAMTRSSSTLLPAKWFQAAESSRSYHNDTNRAAPNSVI